MLNNSFIPIEFYLKLNSLYKTENFTMKLQPSLLLCKSVYVLYMPNYLLTEVICFVTK